MVAIQKLFSSAVLVAIVDFQASLPLDTYNILSLDEHNNRTLVVTAYNQDETLNMSSHFLAKEDLTRALAAHLGAPFDEPLDRDHIHAAVEEPTPDLLNKRLSRCGQYCSNSRGCSFGCYFCAVVNGSGWRKTCQVTWNYHL